MDVVFVTLVDLTGTSGQNVYSRKVAGALAGHENVSLTLICPESKRKLPNELDLACKRIITLPEKSARSLLWHTSVQSTLYCRLTKILYHEDIDILLSTLRPSLLIPPYVTRQHHIQYRILIEGNISHEVDTISSLPLASMISDLVSLWNIRASEQCYVVNDNVKQWVSSLPFNKAEIEILPHGIDVPQLLRQTQQPIESTSEHEFILCYVGSFKDYHCLRALIQAISRLREDNYDVGLSLVGIGPELNSIRKAVEQHEISSATTFHGFVDPSKVPEYIRSADASYGVIDPERTGSPMKVYEYLANGTPVIATADEEFDFVEAKQVGVLIEEPTPEAVVSAIKTIYNIPERGHSEMYDRVRDVGYRNGHTWAEFANRVIKQ